ncbi:MAG: hypothetical protein J6A61_06515 [Clostridia bacterium]|nr:hypothetical protein [Clostridia bacterium]
MKKYGFFTMIIFGLLFMALSAGASDLGYVTTTDIVAFIDYSPIESYNYKDKTYIVAEDLLNYGFDVVWDNQTRELKIDRKPHSFTPYISDFVNEVKPPRTFKPSFLVYPTDIKTYVNGELAESYNIDGRTVLNIDFLYHWGNCIYDDAARRYEVRILEKEIADTDESTQTVDESTDYYKYVKTVTQKGFYENGELIYGIKKNVTTNRFGDNVDITMGNFKENKTIVYTKSYMYFDEMLMYYLDAPAKVNVAGDSLTPGYTLWLDQKSVVKVVSDPAFRYGVRINKISPVPGSDGSEAMYLKADGMLYAIRYGQEDAEGFYGELFKDGKSVYKGNIYYDTFSFGFPSNGYLQNKTFLVLYAPGYTDSNGIIYYKDDSVDGNGSIYYKGQVVNGVAHGEGVMFAYGARNYDTELAESVLVYKDNGVIESIPKMGENVLYQGGFFNGLLHSTGKMYTLGGEISCQGEWLAGVLNGKAILYSNPAENIVGLLYEGEMADNKKSGFGIEYSEKGNPLYEGYYQRFVGEFKDGSWHHGKWYELEYNPEKNLHDIYLYYEGEFRYGEQQHGTHYKYYNEQTGQFEVKTGYFDNWNYVE